MQAWKIQREFKRLEQQFRSIPEFFYEPFLQRWHDFNRLKRLKVNRGQVPACSKFAVFLLFQPRGIADSTILTCEHLAHNGYSPLVVSNAPLSVSDRYRLRSVAWAVIERPNFGYDFGGYRDGIWWLWREHVHPHSFILLNDSIWFPALRDDKTIDLMESMPADFRGILELGPEQSAAMRRLREPFLGSFFLMFSGQAFESVAFRGFWAGYRNTSNKYKTIRRGERTLSYVMRDAGYPGMSVFSRSRFDEMLQLMSLFELRRTLGELVTLNSQVQARLQDAAATYDRTPDPERVGLRSQIIELIQQATRKTNLFSSAPISMLRDFRLPFVKKTKDPWNLKALRFLGTCAVQAPDSVGLQPTVLSELQALVPAHHLT